jgi:hypothetical protein
MHEHDGPICDHEECVIMCAFFLRVKELISTDDELERLVDEHSKITGTGLIATWAIFMVEFGQIMRTAALSATVEALKERMRNASNN